MTVSTETTSARSEASLATLQRCATTALKPLPMYRGKVSKQQFILDLIAEMGLQQERDYKKVLLIAQKRLEQYPYAQRALVGLRHSDVSNAYDLLRFGNSGSRYAKRARAKASTQTDIQANTPQPLPNGSIKSNTFLPPLVLNRNGVVNQRAFMSALMKETGDKGTREDTQRLVKLANERLTQYPAEQTRGVKFTRSVVKNAREVLRLQSDRPERKFSTPIDTIARRVAIINRQSTVSTENQPVKVDDQQVTLTELQAAKQFLTACSQSVVRANVALTSLISLIERV